MNHSTDESEFYRLYRVAMSIADSLDLVPMLDKSLHSFNDNLDLIGSAVLFFGFDGERGGFLDTVHSVSAARDFDDASGEVFRRTAHICDSLGMREIEEKLPLTERLSNGSNLYLYGLPYVGVLVLVKQGDPLSRFVDNENRMLARKLSFACGACLQKSEFDMISSSTTLINRELADSEKNLVRRMDEMRRAHEELNAGKNHLALILQSLGEGVIVADRSGNVLLSNIKALEYFDVMPHNGSRFNFKDLLVNCCDRAASKTYLYAEEYYGEKVTEFEVCGRHGAKRYLRVTSTSLESLLAGLPETIYLVQDITREREIDRIKNEFISNLSHELRTPMNAILGISKMLAEKNSGNLTERQKQGLTIVYESGHRLLSLINDILDLSKIEAGKIDIVIRPVKTSDLIGHVEKIAESLSSEDVAFRIEMSPDVPETIYVDEDRILQVVINLVGNSFKFTSAGTVKLSMERRGGRLFFAVSDTGIGISEEDLPFIFDRFRQGDGSMSRKYQGTGIGLSLSKELVALMGGTISAESVFGEGTVMRFDVPVGASGEIDSAYDFPAHRVLAEDFNSRSVKDRSKTLLIAEDEESERETLRFLLSDRFQLVFAVDGSDAVSKFDTNKIDLVLMDIMMPSIDGYEAYNEIRKTARGRNVPIVAVTARAMAGERERILAHGFDGYVSKPIDSELLIEAIGNLLDSRMKGGMHE